MKKRNKFKWEEEKPQHLEIKPVKTIKDFLIGLLILVLGIGFIFLVIWSLGAK